jgi:hypothetical protein
VAVDGVRHPLSWKLNWKVKPVGSGPFSSTPPTRQMFWMAAPISIEGGRVVSAMKPARVTALARSYSVSTATRFSGVSSIALASSPKTPTWISSPLLY